MKTYPKTPKILPWLAKKAGISESRAAALWHDAERWAAHRAPTGSSLYFKLAVDHLLALALAESLRADAASFGWRPWARAQARFWAISMQAAQHGAALTDRGWRLLRTSVRLHQPG
ncbi:MAG: hypothetical protein IT510_12695 [Sulfuritalea sp.]|jgi:hypothetical protein|nr:hypothetical protein [Sulfuritalea sp.]MCC7312093.1 hypothetical protein [Sulfuritalea sp.]